MDIHQLSAQERFEANLISTVAFHMRMEDPEKNRRVGETARETIPIPWSKVLETAAERYERLVELGKKGQLKDKHRRLV